MARETTSGSCRGPKLAAKTFAVLAAACLAGCGGSGGSHGALTPVPLKPGENPVGQKLYGKTRGGTLTVYSNQDFQALDPGESYFQQDYVLDVATQRPLFAYPPDSATKLRPDLASAMPSASNGGISDGGRIVTVHIRSGVRFSPPVNRAVTSADVAYAIERGANPNVANPYFPSYFGANAPAPLQGAQSPGYKGGPIPGIRTPSRGTIVFHMTRPGAALLVQALSLPLSAPVPESFAGPLDRHTPTSYGSTYLVATGPYMLESNPRTGRFSGLGYQTGRSATLVRNPNWNRATDYRPAYLDRIEIKIGGDSNVIGQQVLKGSHAVQLDGPSHSIVMLAYQRYPSQLTLTPGAGDHYVAFDNRTGPFKNVELRRAVWAALDREAIVKARGGSLVGQPMTHYIYPGVSGFQQAGGYAGPQFDFNQHIDGDLAVARKYMRSAGFSSGRYTGNAVVKVVGATGADSSATTQIVASALRSLGFKADVTLVDQSAVYARYCGVPKREIDACPTVGWVRDFADPLSVLFSAFYGPAIAPVNNPNWGQVDDPQINAAMRKAALVVDPARRAEAWARIDRSLVDQAVAAPEDFDNQASIESGDVAGVDQLWNSGSWDFDFTSFR